MLTEAKEVFHELKTDDSGFVLDRYKVIKMTELIARTDSVESKSLLYLKNER